MITIPMTVATYDETLPMDVTSSEETFSMDIGAEYAIASVDQYEGSYEFTPSEQAQTISISGEMATRDIVVNPIPNNYGLITYNGTTITVS